VHMHVCVLLQGAVPRGDATQATVARMGLKDGDVVYRCPKCDCIKPERAHHCRLNLSYCCCSTLCSGFTVLFFGDPACPLWIGIMSAGDGYSRSGVARNLP